MSRDTHFRNLLVAACALWLPAVALAEEPSRYALRGATVHPVSGPAIENAVVVVVDGTIEAVGADVAVPSGVEVVDLTGLHLYPGFIHGVSTIGLTEISSVRGTRDFAEMGDNNADLRVEVAINADSLLIPPAAWGGVLSAHVVPQGNAVAGHSALIRLDGWNWEDMTVRAGIGLHVYYPSVGSDDDDSDSDGDDAPNRALETLAQVLEEAKAYQKAKAAGGPLDTNAKLEGLLPLLDGREPLFLHAYEKRQIEAALDWAAENELGTPVLVTGSDAQYLAERLATEKVPVLLDGVLTTPNRRWEPYDAPYVAPKVLHEAGVRFAINGERGAFSAAHARNLPFHAAMAAAFGLPKDVALRSVPLSVAEILGVDDRLGAIAPGKEASFFAASGDPLEIVTRIERVWIRGRELDRADDHQWRLYQKYDNRPRPAASE